MDMLVPPNISRHFAVTIYVAQTHVRSHMFLLKFSVQNVLLLLTSPFHRFLMAKKNNSIHCNKHGNAKRRRKTEIKRKLNLYYPLFSVTFWFCFHFHDCFHSSHSFTPFIYSAYVSALFCRNKTSYTATEAEAAVCRRLL